MSFSTFSGPLRSGTQRYGAGTNTGLPVLTQSANVASSVMTGSPTAQNLFTLPAGSKILRFTVEKTTAISGGSVSAVNTTFGNSGTANAYQTTIDIGLTTAQTARATLDAALVSSATNNIGTTDVVVTGTCGRRRSSTDHLPELIPTPLRRGLAFRGHHASCTCISFVPDGIAAHPDGCEPRPIQRGCWRRGVRRGIPHLFGATYVRRHLGARVQSGFRCVVLQR
jgi:hypothetical protein